MENRKNRNFKQEFEMRIFQKQQELVYNRPQYFTQTEIAEFAGG